MSYPSRTLEEILNESKKIKAELESELDKEMPEDIKAKYLELVKIMDKQIREYE